ncbi:sugar ABC transporter substrate-binding protein [Paenibacillus sp. 2TAB23]|uniref:ABC transporter substrate-binding protein n=1 Tax=Paenibacillus sp. 2TAB23 TaxID=3233004 RepID=UPI003F979672
MVNKGWIGAVLVCMVWMLAACSGGPSENSEGSQESEGPVKLSMWVHISEDTLEGKAYKTRAKAFNDANVGKIEVEVQYIARGGGGTGYEDKVNAALTTSSLPDVLTLDGPNTGAYAKSGILLDLSDRLSEESRNDFLTTALQQGTYEGKLYSLAIQESTVAVFYNKDMFVQAGLCKSFESCDQDLGITVEDPWTQDEFKQIATTLKNKFNKPAIDLHLGSQDEWVTFGLAPFIWTNGGELISEDGIEVQGYFNSEKTAKGFTFIQSMINEGLSAAVPEDNAFEVGIYPMSLSSAWTIPLMKYSYVDTVPHWGVLPYPVGESGKLHVPTGSWAFGVSESTKHPEEAAKLAEWMTNKESTIMVTNATGLLPAKTSAYAEVSKYKEGPDKLFMDQLIAGGHPRPNVFAYPELTFSFQQAIDRIVNGKDVGETLDQLTKQLEVKLERHKR